MTTILTGFTSPAVVRSDQLRDEIAEQINKTIYDAGNQGTVGMVNGEIAESDRPAIQAVFDEHTPDPTYGIPSVQTHPGVAEHQAMGLATNADLPLVPPHPNLAAHKAMGLAALTDIPLPGLHPDKAAHLLLGLADANHTHAQLHTHTAQPAITALAGSANLATTVTKVNEIITKLKAYGVIL